LSSTLDQLLAIMDAAYDRKSWHGTNLRGSIRGLTVRQAAWRPSPKRHNIWELIVHAAYWKYTAFRRFTDAPRGSFPLKGSNWFDRREGLSDRAWRDDLALLERTHRDLRAAVTQLTPADLTKMPRGSKVSNFALLSGVAAHDLYHAGQIQLLKRLFHDTNDRGARR
jgi:DinB superfamily